MVLRQGCVAPAQQVPLMQVLDWLRDQFSEERCQAQGMILSLVSWKRTNRREPEATDKVRILSAQRADAFS